MRYLARRDPNLAQSKEIAEKNGIPPQYLAKILHNLTKLGILSSTKGRGGGFRLARPMDEIALLDVVRTIEGDAFGNGCVLDLADCSDENACPLHKEWSNIKGKILDMLIGESVQQLLDEAPASRKDLLRRGHGNSESHGFSSALNTMLFLGLPYRVH